ncbi:MobC family plasmid mobilization relaxosome protein [Listeria booriae]|uniref:MobC family plasmid mobilization relaxosome protein n=1 Tax=Listeria booriae TaxID=1552123 RepID=A0A7X1CI58_9LIST|nr:MobC family plasmid mobilization relaxosome protein [Listeria booriae]MBC1227602.1 MobC family plasmid mobilization relaxosome protein [Listeria booriae]MBC1778664.1 MobC family plasmid mobilization relaxosome protein [Listeria booriae]MBC2002595.1 MobC family plasmid mobilization relaxosome protein [Listeria booriae]MBC2327253.1 MobC family plasmid mobilization relaxosome protein [Listeria booriae]
MVNRTRETQLKFRVNEEEKNFIDIKMKEANISNREAYLRKMAIDGAIITSNFEETKKLIFELNKIGTNINQIAHIANSNADIGTEDIQELKEMMKQIWQLQRSGLLEKHSI